MTKCGLNFTHLQIEGAAIHSRVRKLDFPYFQFMWSNFFISPSECILFFKETKMPYHHKGRPFAKTKAPRCTWGDFSSPFNINNFIMCYLCYLIIFPCLKGSMDDVVNKLELVFFNCPSFSLSSNLIDLFLFPSQISEVYHLFQLWCARCDLKGGGDILLKISFSFSLSQPRTLTYFLAPFKYQIISVRYEENVNEPRLSFSFPTYWSNCRANS